MLLWRESIHDELPNQTYLEKTEKLAVAEENAVNFKFYTSKDNIQYILRGYKFAIWGSIVFLPLHSRAKLVRSIIKPDKSQKISADYIEFNLVPRSLGIFKLIIVECCSQITSTLLFKLKEILEMLGWRLF